MTCVNAASWYVRRLSPSTTSELARSCPRLSQMLPRGRLRRAAMTSGLSARAARFGASRTCHHTMLSDTIAKLSIRYRPSRPDVGGDHAAASASAPIALRWLIESSSPIMMKLASTLDPP